MKTIILILSLSISQLGLSQIGVGMVAHYPLNGNFGDISISNITGINSGTTFGNDYNSQPNSAIILNGSSLISINNPALKVSFPLSLSVWASFDDFNSSRVLFASDNLFNNYSGYIINTVGNQLAVNFGGAAGGANSFNRRSFLSDFSLQTNTWYHFVIIIRSATDMDIFIDCNKTTGTYSGSGSTSIVYSNTNSTIGYNEGNSSGPSGFYHKGFLDQLVIWNREVNSSEIAFLCDSNTTLGLNNTNVYNKFSYSLYPNPTNEIIDIKFESAIFGELNLLSAEGKLLINSDINGKMNTQINLSNLPHGIYFLKIKLKSGQIINQKIIKE